MSWDYKTSEARIKTHLDSMPEIEIKKLERDADLEKLLTESVCREIFGAHVYIDIANFSRLNTSDSADEDLRPLLRAIHIYQRQLSWLVESVFDGVKVHFQGARIHVLFYRPIDDRETLAARAVLLMLVVRDFVRFVFNPLFPELLNLFVCGGAAIGKVIGTRNGMKGDRELLFVGEPANAAAKVIDTGLRITPSLYEVLPEALRNVCQLTSDEQAYRIDTIAREELVSLADSYDVTWDSELATERVEADIESINIDAINLADAEVLIDFDALSIYNNKDIDAASVFADISGFTAFVQSAEDDDAVRRALVGLHLARVEFTRVATHDFNAVRVQFQGDRVQILIHLPKGDRRKISRIAVDLGIALQSSMELSLKNVYPGIGSLHLAIGIDFGPVIATRLGQRGHRDRIVLGESVWCAAAIEDRCIARQIGVPKEVCDELTDEVKEHFEYSKVAQCYVASGLTVATAERKLAAAKYSAPVVFVTRDVSGYTISDQERERAARITPSKSFGA